MLDFEKFKQSAIQAAIERRIISSGEAMKHACEMLSSSCLTHSEKEKYLTQIDEAKNNVIFLLGARE